MSSLIKISIFASSLVGLLPSNPAIAQSISSDGVAYGIDSGGTAFASLVGFPQEPGCNQVCCVDGVDIPYVFSHWEYSWGGDVEPSLTAASVTLKTSSESSFEGDKIASLVLSAVYICPSEIGNSVSVVAGAYTSTFTVVKLVPAPLVKPTNAEEVRTEVGLGEVVSIEAVPSIDGISWSTDGVNGLSVDSGSLTEYTAPLEETSETVTATLPGGSTTSVTFSVIAPTGISVGGPVVDKPVGDPPDPAIAPLFIGGGSKFPCTILPDHVSFVNLNMRENMPEGSNDFLWNNGKNAKGPQGIVDFNVNESNLCSDYSIMPGESIFALTTHDDAVAGAPILGLDTVWDVPLEYAGASDQYVAFYDEWTHEVSFEAGTGKCTLSETGEDSFETGAAQGPYKNIRELAPGW